MIFSFSFYHRLPVPRAHPFVPYTHADCLIFFFCFRLWKRNRLMLLPTNVLTDENYVTEVSRRFYRNVFI